jgi:hypothetical protein
MVPDKKMQRDACIRERSEFAKQANMTLWDHLAVFIPEIKHIAYKEYLSGIIADRIQEPDNGFLPFKAAGMVWCTEMEIGKKVDLFIGG